MAPLELLDEPVSPQQPEQPGDLGADLAAFGRVVGGVRIEERHEIAVAEAVGDEVTAADGLEKRKVGSRPRAEPTDTVAAKLRPTREGFDDLAERRVDTDGRERVEVAVSAGLSKDYAHFLNMAEGSLAELEYLFMLSRDLGYLDAETASAHATEATEISRMAYALRRKVEGDNDAIRSS